MAAPCSGSAARVQVRVRVQFDFPPPAMPDCRMSWMLLDQNRCRFISDLCCLIKQRHGYSRGAELDLYLQDCYLPPAESIHVLRDDDTIRVTVSFPVRKKRCREEEVEVSPGPSKRNRHGEPQMNGAVTETKKQKKKKKKNKLKGEEEVVKPTSAAKEPSSRSKSKKSSRSTSAPALSVNGDDGRTSGSSCKQPVGRNSPHDGAVKPKSSSKSRILTKPAQKARSSGSSSSSEGEEPTKSTLPVKPTSVPPKSGTKARQKAKEASSSSSSSGVEQSAPSVQRRSTALLNNAAVSLKSTPRSEEPKAGAETSTDSSSSSEDDEIPAAPIKPLAGSTAGSRTGSKNSSSSQSSQRNAAPSGSSSAAQTSSTPRTPPPTPTQLMPVCRNPTENPAEDSESSDIELVIRKPTPQLTPGGTPHGRGRGFTDWTRGRGGFGRARGTPWKPGLSSDQQSEKIRKDTQTNRSLVLQNPPQRDYGGLPLLAAPPAVGTTIVFKLLELTENYTPEVSAYKEGKIVGFNPTTSMMELQLLTHSPGRTEPGKFDLVYQNPDGSERVEFAVTSTSSQVMERWESLLEPRLLLHNPE